MKFKLLLIFLLMSSVLSAQYEWKEKYVFGGSNPEGTKAFFLTENEGFVSGLASGISTCVYYTNDGGISWKNIYNSIPYRITDMFFIDKNIGFITDGYTLYRTTDHGENWKLVLERKNTSIFYNIFFKDANNGLLASRGGLFSTTDGGETWHEMDQYISRLSINRETGEGYGLSGDEFYSTSDFGQTWETIYFKAPDLPSYRLKEMLFIDHSGVAVVGYTAELSVARRDVYQKNSVHWPWNYVGGGHTAVVFSDDVVFVAGNNRIFDIKKNNYFYTLSPNDTHIVSFCHAGNVVYALSEKFHLYKYEDPNLTSVKRESEDKITLTQSDRKILLNPSGELKGSYELVDMTGRTIKAEKAIELANKEIEVDNSGIYLIRIHCDESVYLTQKIIVK